MKKILLISCASKKLEVKAKAADLYKSALFKLNLKYARKLKADDILYYLQSMDFFLLMIRSSPMM